jgi:hypothetical protein
MTLLPSIPQAQGCPQTVKIVNAAAVQWHVQVLFVRLCSNELD